LDDVKAFVKERPDSVTVRDARTGRSAFHCAVEDDVADENLSKLAFLLTANPMGAHEHDRWRRYPLHVLAAQRTFRPEMLRLLLHSFPNAMYIRDYSGYLPFHTATVFKNFETAMILLRQYEGEMDCTDPREYLRHPPLHKAMDDDAPIDLLRLWTQTGSITSDF
jgi:hypothetical protein